MTIRGPPGHTVPSMSDAVAAGQTPAEGARTAVAEPNRLMVSRRLWLWGILAWRRYGRARAAEGA